MPETYDSAKHDIGLKYSGTTYGLMLAQEEYEYNGVKNTRPVYQTLIDEYIAEQQATGQPGYEHLPVEKELSFVQSSYRSGFGQEFYDALDPERYNTSIGMDLRHKGMAILSNEETGLAVPSTTAPTAWCEFNDELYVAFGIYLRKLNGSGNGWTAVKTFTSPITDMKVFADGYMYIAVESTQIIEDCEDAWTSGADATASLDTGDYKVGSGSCKLVGAGVNLGAILAYENFSSTDFSSFTGISLWIKSSVTVAAADLVLALDDTNNCVSPVESISIPALTAGKWTKIYARMADPSNCSAIVSVGLEYNANVADTTIHLDDIRAESSYWYMDTGENFTQSDLSVAPHDSFAKYFQPVGATMWKHLSVHNLYSATDPSNIGGANWSGVTEVDTPNYDILKLLSNGTTLVIKKEDRTFYLDTSGNVQILIEEMKHLSADTTGTSGTYWQGKYYIPCGAQSLIEYDGGTISWRSPSKYSSSISTFNGKVQAVTGDEEYLFAIIDNSSSVEVLAGRSEVISGSTRWVWHPLQEFTLEGCSLAFVSSVFQKRLWIGSTSGSQNIFYIPLPAGYGDMANDANIKVPTTGTHYFETPKLHYNFQGDLKTAIKITVELGHSWDTDIYFECWSKMGDGSYVDVGDLKGTSGTRIATLYFAANTTDRNLQLKFVGKTDASGTTPILLWYDLRAILYPTRRNLTACTVRAADNIKDKAGNTMSTTAAEIRTYLEAARDATYPVDFEDLWSTAKKVRVLALRGQPFSTIHKQAKGENIEEHFHLLLEEVRVA